MKGELELKKRKSGFVIKMEMSLAMGLKRVTHHPVPLVSHALWYAAPLVSHAL